MCHGETGDGKGEVAVAESYNLKDFRDPESLKSRTDQDIFNLLKKGKGHMPLEPVRMTPNELWNLINYIRTMATRSDAK
jgi:mono/diheme cytochrome c family protein